MTSSSSLVNIDKITLDVDLLGKQYARLQERQKQARIILAGQLQTLPLLQAAPPRVAFRLVVIATTCISVLLVHISYQLLDLLSDS